MVCLSSVDGHGLLKNLYILENHLGAYITARKNQSCKSIFNGALAGSGQTELHDQEADESISGSAERAASKKDQSFGNASTCQRPWAICPLLMKSYEKTNKY